MLTVKIQQIQVKVIGGEPLPPIIDISDRISIDQIRSLTERVEAGRFSFTTSDLDIKDVVNSDGFIELGSDYINNGLITYVEWNGTEIFRGISTYNDFKFQDAPIKTVGWRSYDWTKRLRDTTITDWESPTTLGELEIELERLIRFSDGKRPTFDHPVIDFSGVVNIDFDVEMGDENPLENFNYKDVWQEPNSRKFFGFRFNADIGSSGGFEIYRLKGNEHELVKTWEISLGVSGVSITILDYGFIRAVCSPADILSVFYTAEYTTGGTRVLQRRILIVGIDDFSAVEGTYSATANTDNLYVIGAGTTSIINAGFPVCSDGQNIYLKKTETDGTIYLEKRTRSGAYIGRANLSPQPNNLTAINTPYLDTVVYHNGIRWYWFRWTTAGDYVGSISVGEALPERTYTEIYPTGYEQDEYMGKYHYYIWLDVPGIIYIDYWWKNDPIFILLSALYYEETTLENILTDIAQMFDCYYFHRDGTVYLLNRGDYANDIGVSQDYILNANYGRTLRDDSNIEPRLDLKALGVSDDSDDPYNTRTLAGALRTYYRDSAQAKWIRRRLVLPLEVGKDIRLGDQVTITEERKTGVVIERKIDFASMGKMSEITMEYKDL